MNKKLISFLVSGILLMLPLKGNSAEMVETFIPNPFIPQTPVEKIEKKIESPIAVQKPVTETKIEQAVVSPKKNLEEENKIKMAEHKALQEQEQKRLEEERIKKEAMNQTAPELTITGLVWNSEKPQAIINGKVLNIGDVVIDSENNDEIKIKQIHKTGIEVSYKGKTWTIAP